MTDIPVVSATETLLASELREQARSATSRLVLDLTATRHVDGAALSALVSLYRRLSEQGGKVVLCGLNPDLREIFERTVLSKLIPIVLDRGQALEEARR